MDKIIDLLKHFFKNKIAKYALIALPFFIVLEIFQEQQIDYLFNKFGELLLNFIATIFQNTEFIHAIVGIIVAYLAKHGYNYFKKEKEGE